MFSLLSNVCLCTQSALPHFDTGESNGKCCFLNTHILLFQPAFLGAALLRLQYTSKSSRRFVKNTNFWAPLLGLLPEKVLRRVWESAFLTSSVVWTTPGETLFWTSTCWVDETDSGRGFALWAHLLSTLPSRNRKLLQLTLHSTVRGLVRAQVPSLCWKMFGK